jgi:uncharacterized membrane-anchored protein
LLLQTGLIMAVPLQAAIATLMGTTIILRTVPVDPYDPFRGYYTTLQYDISQRGVLSTLEGWEAVQTELEPTASPRLLRPGRHFFVILAEPSTADPTAMALHSPWQPIAISQQRPTNLPADQIAIKGQYRSDRIAYGMERYYLPEAQRLDLERRIRDAQSADDQPRLMVEIRVGPFGQAVPIALWLQGDRIEF